MNYKDQSKRAFFWLLSFLKPLATALILVVILQMTGLMSSVSYVSQWALLETGLKDAGDEISNEGNFDYQFTIKDLEENKIPVDKFKGKVIFLNMWATWCGPCRAEMAGIQKLYEKVDKDKIVFIMLSIDKDSDKSKVIDYLKKKEFTFPGYMPSGFLPNQLRVPSIPTTFVISKDGKIVRKEVGTARYDTQKFQDFLEELSR